MIVEPDCPRRKPALRLLVDEIRALSWRYPLFLLVIAVVTGVGLLPPKLFIFFTDGAYSLKTLSETSAHQFLQQLALFGGILAGILFLSRFVSMVTEEWIYLSVEANLRRNVLAKVQRTPLEVLDTTQRGDWLTRMTGDLRNAESFITSAIPGQITSIITIVAVTGIFIAHSGWVASCLLATAFILALFNVAAQRRISPMLDRLRNLHGNIFQALLENYEGIRTIRSLGAEAFIGRQFDLKVRDIISGGLRVVRMMGLVVGSNTFFTEILITGCLVWVGLVLKEGKVSVTDIMVYPFYIGMFYSSALGLAGALFDWSKFFIESGRLAEILYSRDVAPNVQRLAPVDAKHVASLLLSDVVVGFADGAALTRPFKFQISRGEMMWVKGHSGSGKSTFCEMIAGLRALPASAVHVRGPHDQVLAQLDLTAGEALLLPSSLSAYVEQVPYIFEGSIYDNVAFGLSGSLDEAEVWRALRAVNLEDFVAERGGLSSKLSDAGKNLSEGQKYRLALARVLVIERPIIVFDEPFAALDEFSAAVVCHALNALKSRSALLIVSHYQPESLRVDRILDFASLKPRQDLGAQVIVPEQFLGAMR